MPDINKKIDISTIFGIIIAFILVIIAIFAGGNAAGFIDIRAILIVLLGTLFITIASYSFKDVFHTKDVILKTIFYSSEKPSEAAITSMKLSEIVRKKGVLAIDKHPELTVQNSLLQRTVNMIADHIELDQIEHVIKNEIESLMHRHAKSVDVLRKAADISPSMGLIGTLIGLVQMLGNLDDSASIGPAMAVALLTTFYGAVMSYMFFTPLASKLERNTQHELLIANIYATAVESISKKESPRKLEILLNSILPPDSKIDYYKY